MNQTLIYTSFAKSIWPLTPELVVLVMTGLTLLASAFAPNRRNVAYLMAQFTVIAALVLSPIVHHGWENDLNIVAANGMFVLDRMAVVLKLFITICVFVTFLYSRKYNLDRKMPHGEFYILGLLSMLGMMVLVSGNNLVTLYLGLELMSLPIYAMVALQRTVGRCVEASMKYFLFGALASGLLLYGFSMIFGATRSLNVMTIANTIPQLPHGDMMLVTIGVIFIIAALSFKLGAAPFHMWVPDVYDGAPLSTTLFLSTGPKLAAFGFLIRLLDDMLPSVSHEWSLLLIVIAIVSMAIGNLTAIVQTNIRRLLGYSSIAHMGYMLLGVATMSARGNAASLFYVITYAIMTVGAFGIITLLSQPNKELLDLTDLKGLNTRSPWLAFMMLILVFSMAGIPPLVGFIAKIGILEALIQAHLVWLAVVMVVFAIIGVYYYLRVIKVMYFEEPENDSPIVYPIEARFVMSLNGLAILLFGIVPGLLFAMSHFTLAI